MTPRGGPTLTATVRYSAPSILRTAPLSTAGGEVTLFGENLGTPEDAAAGLLTVTFDGVPATALTVTQAHKKVRCEAPPGMGSARVQATLGGQASDEYDALFAPPDVHTLDPPDVDLGGGEVTLTGVNFGGEEGRIKVLLPDVGKEATDIVLVEAHTKVRCRVPPLPPGSSPGEPLRMRLVVGGIFATMAVDLVYSPPGGVAAREGRPAYITRRPTAPPQLGGKGLSPLSSLFSSSLTMEGAPAGAGAANTVAAGAGAGGIKSPNSAFSRPNFSSPSSSSPGASQQQQLSPAGQQQQQPHNSASASASHSDSSSPVVRGSLTGEGPSLTITPKGKWEGDTPACSLCTRDFGVTRRRHHCRVCGKCVCASCSPFDIRLTSASPPVRLCSRCNLRVDLLKRMTSCMDTIEGIKRQCGVDTDLFSFFKAEVVQCVSTPPMGLGSGGGGGAGAGGAAGAAAAAAASKSPATASLTPIGKQAEGENDGEGV